MRKCFKLPREIREILVAYKQNKKVEMKREELRKYSKHLPTQVFEYALAEMALMGILERRCRRNGIVYVLKEDIEETED